MNLRISASIAPASAKTDRQQFLEAQPTYWLKRVYQALRRRVDSELRPLAITLSQRDALLSLFHEGPSSHGALSDRLGLEQSSVSRLVEGLEKRGLVASKESEIDRRSRVVSLTESGRRLLQSTPGSSQLAGTMLAGALTESELRQLISLLRKCAEVLELNHIDDAESRPKEKR
jgi:DNA-binding MarR family transcriptional regulator